MKKLEKEMLDFMATTFRSMGLPEVMVKVMSVLYLEPKEIAMDKVANKTGYSLASISTTIKMMESMRVLQRTRKPGTRKVYLYMEKNLAKLNINKIRAFQEIFIRKSKMFMPEFIDNYKKRVKNENSKQRLDVIENYYAQLVEFGKLMNRWTKDLEKLSRKYSKKVV